MCVKSREKHTYKITSRQTARMCSDDAEKEALVNMAAVGSHEGTSRDNGQLISAGKQTIMSTYRALSTRQALRYNPSHCYSESSTAWRVVLTGSVPTTSKLNPSSLTFDPIFSVTPHCCPPL